MKIRALNTLDKLSQLSDKESSFIDSLFDYLKLSPLKDKVRRIENVELFEQKSSSVGQLPNRKWF